MDEHHLISEAIHELSTLLSSRINAQDSRLKKTAITLAYWVKDYVRLLSKELSAPTSNRRYDRGCVVSVHLGFRIGHEEGGIVTISKLRIYDPCSSKDLLYNIKVSNITMDKIDEKIKQLYIN